LVENGQLGPDDERWSQGWRARPKGTELLHAKRRRAEPEAEDAGSGEGGGGMVIKRRVAINSKFFCISFRIFIL
jgi:hypothetical protein